MNEEDRSIVEYLRKEIKSTEVLENPTWSRNDMLELIAIIERLDEQLAGIVEAGEPFAKVGELISNATRQELWVHTQNPKPDLPLVITIGRAQRDPYDIAQVILLEKSFRRLAEKLKEVSPSVTKCRWVLDDDGVYQTSCDGAWELTTGNLSDNGVKFCPYCGGQIAQALKGVEDG